MRLTWPKTLLIIAGIFAVGAAVAVPLAVHAAGAPARRDAAAIKACEDSILAQLKAPATAKFSGAQIRQTDTPSAPMIVGYVDSENGFSALVRSSFVCFMVTNNGQLQVSQSQVNQS